MSFATLHKVVAYLLAALGFGALVLGGELSTIVSIGLMLAGIGSYFAEAPLIDRPAWSRGWTIAVAAVFAIEILRVALLGESLLTCGIEAAAALQLSRLYNRRGAREYQQIAILAFLHLIAGAALSTELAYAAVFIGFVVVTPWMLTLSHLRREVEGNYPGATVASGRSAANVTRVLASRRVVGARLLAGTASLSIPLFALTGLLFLLFPRVGLGILTFGRNTGQRVAGFGSTVELGGFGVIRDDPTVVVRVTPPPGLVVPAGTIRLRGTSFDRWDGRRWTRTPGEPRSLGRVDDEYPLARYSEPPRDQAWRIVLDALDEPVLFLPPGTVSLAVPTRTVSGVERGRQLTRGHGLDVRYTDGDDLGLVYSVWVSERPRDLYVIDRLGDLPPASYLSLPSGSERVVALARQITSGARTDAERAARIQSYLRDEGRFRYTLDQPDTGTRSPVEVFLFEAKAGHCEYFATAMAVLLRAVGVPARNVTGFAGGRFNPYGNYWALRQGDAHSWVEARVEPTGWSTYDPTPPSREGLGPSEGMLSGIDALVDALRTRWTERVVGYDLRSQMELLRGLAEALRSLREEGSVAERRGTARARSHSGAWPLVALALALAVAAVLAYRFVRARRVRAKGVQLAGDARDAVALYRELEAALLARGAPRPPGRTPLEHAEVLSRAGFARADVVLEITRAYVAARFAGQPLDDPQLSSLRAKVRSVRRA